MIDSIPQGTYIVAVSGGIDSVALLHALHKLALEHESGIKLVVAHFDHGIRDNSHLDAQHVKQLAEQLELPFESGRAELGPRASEELARDMRYNFLKVVRAKYQADAIITAHHQDDVLETVVINLSRGTGRHGLSSLSSSNEIIRPLLSLNKEEVTDYAVKHDLEWREDPTNQNTDYLRNHIRKNIIPKLEPLHRAQLIDIIVHAETLNKQIDRDLETYLMYKSFRRNRRVYSRRWFNALPHDFACHIVHHWMRMLGVVNYNKKQIEKLVILIKVARPGKSFDIDGKTKVLVTKRSIRLLSNS